MIHQDILQRSMEKAQEVLDISFNLREAGVKADYLQRDDFWQQLVGEQGYMMFHPEVEADLVPEFRDVSKDDIHELEHVYNRLPYGRDQVAHLRFQVAQKLVESINTEHLLQNTVPNKVMSYIEAYCIAIHNDTAKEAKSYRSPKLSKLLVKLFGEKSETVKWYTTKCPKNLDSGLLKEWTITISILPHHIAGMSYYAAANHGGDKWIEGWNGTSCMDTKRNGIGSGVFQLVPSMRDVTMAVAYLSRSEDKDVWNPIYQARALLRVVHIHGEPHFLICRPYFTSRKTRHILIEGLKNAFPNAHYTGDMRSFDGEGVQFRVEYPKNIELEVDKEFVCSDCEGDGFMGYDQYNEPVDCETCHGEGRWHIDDSFLPYIDDHDFIIVNHDEIVFKLPVKYFASKGVDLNRPEKKPKRRFRFFDPLVGRSDVEPEPVQVDELAADIEDIRQELAVREYEVEMEDWLRRAWAYVGAAE